MPLVETQPDAVSQVYAQSLFTLAQEAGGQGNIESILSELEDVVEMARNDAAFGEFLASRIVSRDDRDGALVKIFQGRCSDLVLNFLRLLNRKGRLGAITGIVAAYDRTVQNAFGRIEVDVYTATPISEDERRMLADKLRAELGKEPIIHPYTDGAMLGGIKLQIGDQLIDASVSTALRKLQDQMANHGLPAIRSAAEKLFNADPRDNGH